MATPPEIDALRETAASIGNHLRFYDLLIRYGGDEFVCGLVDVTMVTAAERFSLVKEDLSANQQPRVTVGLAELRLDESIENLIARADHAIYNERRRLRSADAWLRMPPADPLTNGTRDGRTRHAGSSRARRRGSAGQAASSASRGIVRAA